MALEFENQTPQSVNGRMAADVKLSAPRSNPTKKNSFIFSLVKGFALRIYDFYQQLKRLKTESFPDTSTINGELKRWGNYRKINIKSKTGAEGVAIASGTIGDVLAKGSTATIDGVTYETQSEVTISEVSYALVSLSRNGTTVTAKTASNHNLASSLTANISGADQSVFNGSFEISAIDATTFTYQVESDDQFEQATGILKASFDIAFVDLAVSPTSEKTGLASNQDAGTSIKLDTQQTVDENLLVSYSGLAGGADDEGANDYRGRVIDAYQNPIALFNPAAISQQIRQEVANATRVWVKETFPEVGQVTIYFTTDNTGVIPTGQDVNQAIAAVRAIKPSNTADSDIFLYAPNPDYVDFHFASLSPNTTKMREAITDRLKELFYTSAEVEKPLTSEQYRAKIQNTIDATGAKVEQYSLREPIGDINPGTGGIPVLRNITFSDSSGEIFMSDLFDGQSGRSDGTADGFSKEITGSNQTVDISVYGTFDGAQVTLQQYGTTQNKWFDTSALWDSPDKFQGLTIKAGERYRLAITSAGATTDISSEVFYG